MKNLFALLFAAGVLSYDPRTALATSNLRQDWKECEVGFDDVICSCQSNAQVKPQVELKDRVIYILHTVDDKVQTGKLRFTNLVSFMCQTVNGLKNSDLNYYFKYIAPSMESDDFDVVTIDGEMLGHFVTECSGFNGKNSNQISDALSLKVKNPNNPNKFLFERVRDHGNVPLAYNTLRDDLTTLDSNIPVLVYSVFPDSENNDEVINCDFGGNVIDSASVMSITNDDNTSRASARYNYVQRCASGTKNSKRPTCPDMESSGFSNIASRTNCPFVWPERSLFDFDIPMKIATSFVTTLNNLPPVITSGGDPPKFTITTTVPEVPNDVTCNYDVVVAIDLECIDNEENSVVSFFVENLITDIFAEIETVVTTNELKMNNRRSMDPSVRVAIVGFHKDIEVEYNLYQMSIVGNYRDSMHRITQEKAKALQAVQQLLNYVAYVRTGDSLGFLDIFQKLAHFFDHRSHKQRKLVIVTNAVRSGTKRGAWTENELSLLTQHRDEYFNGIEIRAVAINQMCQNRYARFQEDCAYFEALKVIDSAYASSSAEVLCIPGGGQACKTHDRDMAMLRSVFYSGFLVTMREELTSISYMKYCYTPPPPNQECSCASRGYIRCYAGCLTCGPNGPRGPKGPDGPKGPPGLSGYVGPPGVPAEDGRPARPGPKGIPGLPHRPDPITKYGPPGPCGPDGEKGVPGPPGNTGIPGQEGQPGPCGDHGDPGRPGQPGLPGRPGLNGNPGDCGPKGHPGRTGRPGTNQIIAELDQNLDEIIAMNWDMLDNFFEDSDKVQMAQVSSDLFVGHGNNGKTFCSCSDCKCETDCCNGPPPTKAPTTTPRPTTKRITTTTPATTTPVPPPRKAKCEECEKLITPDSMVIFDVSGSVSQVRRKRGIPTRVHYADIAGEFVQKWSQKTKNADAKLAIGRFETFLGIGAKLECSAGTSGYNFTDYTGGKSTTIKRGSASQISNDIKQQVNVKYRKVQNGKGQWRQRMRQGLKYNRANRFNYVKDNGNQYMTFFFSMLGDLNIWMNQNWQHSNQQKTQLFVVTDAMLFQDAPVEWQLAVEKKCNNNQDAFISRTDYEHRINTQNPKQVCDLFRDLETNFETINIWPTSLNSYKKLSCTFNTFHEEYEKLCGSSFKTLKNSSKKLGVIQMPSDASYANFDRLIDIIKGTVDMNKVQCCKSGIFDVAVHSSAGVKAFPVTRDENCNSFSSELGHRLYLAEGEREWVLASDDQSFVTSNEVANNCCPLAVMPELRSVTPSSSYMKIRCREEVQARSGRDATKPEPGVLTKRRRIENKP